MPASRCVLGILILLGIYLSGCDKPQGSSTAQANAGSSAATQPAVAVPPRGPVSLVSVPVLVILPADWSLDPPGSPNFLKGPAPDGNVRISLSMLESMDGNRRDRFLVAAADLAQKHPQRIQVRQLTSRNGMQILERVTYSSATGSPGAQLSAATLPSDKISWNLILFVPYEKRFIPCSFDLFGLTEDQYHNDQQFVEAIVDSAQPGTLQVAQ